MSEPFNVVNFIIRVEGGDITDNEEFVSGCVSMLNRGVGFNLQGSWSSTLGRLIEQGYIAKDEKGHYSRTDKEIPNVGG